VRQVGTGSIGGVVVTITTRITSINQPGNITQPTASQTSSPHSDLSGLSLV